VQLLGGQQRKALRQVVPILPPENRKRAGARAIGLGRTFVENVL